MQLGRQWWGIAMLSGAAALAYESVWLRRLGLVLGGSSTASALTLAVFMGGLGLGALLAPRLKGPPARIYGLLELSAAAWALGFPWLLPLLDPWQAALLPLPAAIALGATWPLLARALRPDQALQLYAANTLGAVLGVIGTTFVVMPSLGVRAAELAAVSLGVLAAWLAFTADPLGSTDAPATARPSPAGLFAAFAAGGSALGLEVLWMRLAAVGLGATVQTLGLVLAVFLATTALGAHLGRTWPREPGTALGPLLVALGAAALFGAFTWGALPYGLALGYRLSGPEYLWLVHVLLALVWMGGAPLLSGITFSVLLRSEAVPSSVGDTGAWMYGLNTLGATLGAPLTGLLLLPELGPDGAVLALTAVVWLAALAVAPRLRIAAAVVALVVLGVALPPWNARLYAVGVHLKVSDFADLDTAAVRTYASENWDLLHYAHGRTAAVAVGRSRRTGNIWLSINGKFDASTGDDMPTQELSARIPLSVAPRAANVGIVGLASGVTAGTALEDERIQHLDVFELEPAVVVASHWFDHVNRRPLDDPRTRLIVDDARAAFQKGAGPYDVLISEPSNPWITGVSNLFTQEYWELARSRLTEDGVFCQWVQLYGMGPDEFRALIRTFTFVFGDVWLYETIPGSDVLLVAGPAPTDASYTLDPDGVRRLGGIGWLNTDDHPRIEWAAPRWLHYDTAEQNAQQILRARRSP